jgi:hypothetical protein
MLSAQKKNDDESGGGGNYFDETETAQTMPNRRIRLTVFTRGNTGHIAILGVGRDRWMIALGTEYSAAATATVDLPFGGLGKSEKRQDQDDYDDQTDDVDDVVHKIAPSAPFAATRVPLSRIVDGVSPERSKLIEQRSNACLWHHENARLMHANFRAQNASYPAPQ